MKIIKSDLKRFNFKSFKIAIINTNLLLFGPFPTKERNYGSIENTFRFKEKKIKREEKIKKSLWSLAGACEVVAC